MELDIAFMNSLQASQKQLVNCGTTTSLVQSSWARLSISNEFSSNTQKQLLYLITCSYPQLHIIFSLDKGEVKINDG